MVRGGGEKVEEKKGDEVVREGEGEREEEKKGMEW